MEKLKRKIKVDKEEIMGDSTQFAFNSWGHLTIRTFNKENPDEDTLVVLTRNETMRLRSFLRNIGSGYGDC